MHTAYVLVTYLKDDKSDGPAKHFEPYLLKGYADEKTFEFNFKGAQAIAVVHYLNEESVELR